LVNSGKFAILGILVSLSIFGIKAIEQNALSSDEVQTQECDTSYPDVCIASPPPDLNCANISDKSFKVVSPDPHGFDREGDGIG
jgi:hypothetical protein